MTALFNLFYVSRGTTSDANVIAAIAAESQPRNERDRITGLLLFDGLDWCQYIEGPQESVDRLHERLRRDWRHRDMQVIQQGPAGEARLFPNWRMGYSYIADEAAIRRVLAADPHRAVDTFRAIDRDVDETKYGPG